MSNKLKEVMKKEFDKDMNYNSILSKVEREIGRASCRERV